MRINGRDARALAKAQEKAVQKLHTQCSGLPWNQILNVAYRITEGDRVISIGTSCANYVYGIDQKAVGLAGAASVSECQGIDEINLSRCLEDIVCSSIRQQAQVCKDLGY